MGNAAVDFTQLSLMDALDLAVLIEEEAEETIHRICENARFSL